MAAVGFGLPKETFADFLEYGPHLLAPTGSDLSGVLDGSLPEGAVLAGFHTDLNFLTIHGKSRYPGLAVWRRDGRAVAPSIPEGHLLVQAGKQLEYLTGGRVLAGFHEVAVTRATIQAATERTTATESSSSSSSKTSLWRVSSTCFAHVASDKLLRPLLRDAPRLATSPTETKEEDVDDDDVRFPPIKAGDQVKNELDAINLKS